MDSIIGQAEDFDHVEDVRFTDDFKTEVTGEKNTMNMIMETSLTRSMNWTTSCSKAP